MKGLPSDPYGGAGARRAVQSGVRYARGGSTGSGLLLALVVYPVFLSILKYGADGPGRWFRAKWLNQASSDTTPPATATPRQPSPPAGKTPAGGATTLPKITGPGSGGKFPAMTA